MERKKMSCFSNIINTQQLAADVSHRQRESTRHWWIKANIHCFQTLLRVLPVAFNAHLLRWGWGGVSSFLSPQQILFHQEQWREKKEKKKAPWSSGFSEGTPHAGTSSAFSHLCKQWAGNLMTLSLRAAAATPSPASWQRDCDYLKGTQVCAKSFASNSSQFPFFPTAAETLKASGVWRAGPSALKAPPPLLGAPGVIDAAAPPARPNPSCII